MSLLTVTVSALLVLTVAVLNSAEGRACAGCFHEVSVDDKNLKKTLNMALTSANAGDYKVIKIIKAEKQVVAGFRYRIEFAAKIPGKGNRVCRLTCVQLIKKPLKVEGLSCK
uniref:Venom cystatin-like protein 1 n=1 Tax=Pristhesancus plagipennis TaxID=1955184 RepID=A0A1Q1NP99_PRIPG|nr:venom cystatin-like protein 1 [Pristhesancus plagipennis]